MSDVVCDLDGVIYRGDTVLAGVPEALESLAEADVDVLFVTNNSSASTIKVAEKIERLTGHGITEDQVINSAQAGASVLTSSDAPTLVVGEEGIHEALAHRGIETTISPDEANSVVVGICRTFTYDLLSDAVRAIRAGARFVATNTDPTYPVVDRVVPGAGSIVSAVATAAEATPEVAGKPNPPIRRLIESRVGSDVWVIGDRLDTDIALAHGAPRWHSILVLSGVTNDGSGPPKPDHVVADFSAAAELVLSRRDG